MGYYLNRSNKSYIISFEILFIHIGLLSLRKLTGVDIGDAHFLRTIGSMCPHLKHVSFQDYSGCNISPDELESILNRWPKVILFNESEVFHQHFILLILF